MLREPPIIPGVHPMRVVLDKKSLFALASDTRLEILKSLQHMRRTVSQLSEEMQMDKAGVHRHLKKLEEGGLVKRYEDHGFVYYGLTWMGRDLMSPNENTKIVIMISTSWLLVIFAAFFLVLGMNLTGLYDSGQAGFQQPEGAIDDDTNYYYYGDYETDSEDRSILSDRGDEQPVLLQSGDSAVVVLSIAAVLAGAVALLAISARRLVKPKQKGSRRTANAETAA